MQLSAHPPCAGTTAADLGYRLLFSSHLFKSIAFQEASIPKAAGCKPAITVCYALGPPKSALFISATPCALDPVPLRKTPSLNLASKEQNSEKGAPKASEKRHKPTPKSINTFFVEM